MFFLYQYIKIKKNTNTKYQFNIFLKINKKTEITILHEFS